MRLIEKARFIAGASDFGEAAPIFRKRIPLRGRVREAFLQATSLGVYECSLSGARVGDALFAPGWTNYHKRLQYQQYDVTSFFVPEQRETELSIWVGKGWYGSRISYGAYGGGPLAARAALSIRYADGTQELIGTDETWECAQGQVLESDLYDGETYDAGCVPVNWGPVRVLEDPKGPSILVEQEGEAVRAQQTLSPVRLFSTPTGERVLDFGQNLTGFVRFTALGRPGDEVLLSCAEVLDANGNFYTENYRSAKSRIRFICGEVPEAYQPRFSFQGFRYIRVDAWPGELCKECFAAIVVHSDMERTGDFRCSHAGLNLLFQNILWGQRGNFLDIPTDCPQRDERQGWTGDAQVFCRAASYHYDVERFFRKWLRDLKSEQKSDGSIPRIIPNAWRGQSPAPAAWGDAAVIIPWQLYETYGDRGVLEEQFESMKGWVDYLREQGTEECLWNTGEQYGDWLGLDAKEGSYQGKTDPYLIATAYFYHSTVLLCKAGHVLKKDMAKYETLAKGIFEAFGREYADGERLISDTQTAYALALCFGLSGSNREAYANRLEKLIGDNQGKLSTGFVGTPCLLHALADNGKEALAYALLFEEEAPSFLFPILHGATTVWEHWDGLKPDGSMWSPDMNSFNHYAYGAAADFLYQKVCGIRPVEGYPGFERVHLEPIVTERLSWAAASLHTRRGLISSSWERKGGEWIFTFQIPETVRAQIVLPGQAYEVPGGRYQFHSLLVNQLQTP